MARKIRPIRVKDNIAFITLTKGYTAIIDVADLPLVRGGNWQANPQPHATYAQRMMAGRARLMHRVIMGEPEGLLVDHIDGDGLNNRRSNLRTATQSQSQHNKGVQRNNTSGFKGVRWKADKGMWVARIDLHGKRKHVGYFGTAEDAHAAYCRASADLHGAFSRTA
jgi:hypothetical protein